MVFFILLVSIALCFKPDICHSEESNCSYDSVPSCSVCCSETIESLLKCIAGDVSHSENYDYSRAKTIYIKGGEYDFQSLTTGIDLSGRSGEKGAPIRILPYNDETVLFTGSSKCFYDSKGAGVSFWEIGSPMSNDRIICESLLGLELACVTPNCNPEAAFHDLKFQNIDFTIEGKGSITIRGEIDNVPTIGLIEFIGCTVHSNDRFLGFMFEHLFGDVLEEQISSVVRIYDCFVETKGNLFTFENQQFVEFDVRRNHFKISDYEILINLQDFTNGIAKFYNNVFETIPLSIYNTNVLMNVVGNLEGPNVQIFNNLFQCYVDAPTSSKMFFVDLVDNFEVYNNVFLDCETTLVESVNVCFEVVEGACEISENFFNTPDFVVTQSEEFLTVGNNYLDQTITLQDGLIMEDLFSKNNRLLIYDKDGKVRANTRCPNKAGPFTNCESEITDCINGWEGDTCNCNVDAKCSEFSKNNIDPISSSIDRANIGDFLRRSDDSVTARDVCIGEYVGILIDSDNKLWIWGEDIDNDYIEEDTTDLTEVDTTEWIGIPKKVQCTHTGLFVLTNMNVLYIMGRNEDHDLKGGKILTSFTEDLHDVYDISASIHSFYATLMTQTNDIFDIKVIGVNKDGSFGANFLLDHSGDSDNDYVNVDTSMFPANVYPKTKAFESGVWFTFNDGKLNFYSGKDHPSAGGEQNIPVKIDFAGIAESELLYSDPIDQMDRIIGGCLYIISGEQIFVQGIDCNNGFGIDSNEGYIYPFEITPYQYGDYEGAKIYGFTCGYMCYLSTREAVYVFGNNEYGNIGLAANCDEHDCDRFTLASEEVQYVVPGLGHTIPNEIDSLSVIHEVLLFNKPENGINTFDDEEIYKFPAEIVYSNSGMVDNQFLIEIKKAEVYQQLEPEILFVNSINNDTVSHRCRFPGVGKSDWKTWNQDAEDHYYLELSWKEHRIECGWEYIVEDDFDIYSNKMLFREYFYLGKEHGKDIVRMEEYIFNLQVRFPKQILQVEVEVINVPLSEYWDVYVIDKSFDRETRIGMIEFNTVVKTPNYFVFKDPKLGVYVPNDPNFFEDSSIYEYGGNSKRSYLCDEQYCQQRFTMNFKIVSDYRVCSVPNTKIPVYWTTTCVDDDHEDCISPGADVEFNVMISVDNLCNGELIEDIITTFSLTMYNNWDYSLEIDPGETIFIVNDYFYLKAEVSATKVSIVKTEVSSVAFGGTDTEIVLYENKAATEVGKTCEFVVDDIESATEIGIKFKAHNQIVNLQPTEQKKYYIKVQLAVTYEGNVSPVERRGEDIEFRSLYLSKEIELSVESAQASGVNVVPYVISAVAIFVVGIVLAILAVLGYVVISKVIKSKTGPMFPDKIM